MKGINISGPYTDIGPEIRLKIDIKCEYLKYDYVREHKDLIKELLNTEFTKNNIDKVSIFIDAKDKRALYNSCIEEIIEILGTLNIFDIWIYTELEFNDIMECHFYWFTRLHTTYVCGKYSLKDSVFNGNNPVYRKSFNQRIWQGKALQNDAYANMRYKDITAKIDPNYSEYILYKNN